MLTQVRIETAEWLSQKISAKYSLQAPLTKEALTGLLEVPKKLEHGHLAFPVFSLAKELRKAPPMIASELAQALSDMRPPSNR
jgi:arginyl-tRNA synthetase